MYREYNFSSSSLTAEFFNGMPRNSHSKYKKTSLQPHTNTDNIPTHEEQKNEQKTCYHCGLQWKLRHRCAAFSKYCRKCGKKGHFARVCHFFGQTHSQNEASFNQSARASPETLHKSENRRQRGNSERIIKPKKIMNEELSQMKVRANTLYAQGSYNLALPIYSELIRKYPEAKNYGNRAACYMMMSQYDNALYDAKKAIELENTFIKAYVRALKSAFAIGNLFEVERVLNQLTIIDPHNSIVKSERINICRIREYLKSTDEAYITKNYSGALLNINKALELCTHCISYKVKKAEYLYLLGRYEDAQIVVNNILNSDPSNIDAKHILGLCIYQSDANKAVLYFKDILRLIPDDIKIINIYKKAKMFVEMKENGNDAFRKKKYRAAYELYTKALQIDPNNKGMNKILYYNQAQTSYKLGNIQQSIIECTKALAIDPHYVKALMRRSQCYIDQKQYEEAVADLAKACEIDSSTDCKNLLERAIKLLIDAQSDYHGILGINQNASEAEIKTAYKKKALLHHPDRHANSSNVEKIKHEKIFKQITQAYRLLITRCEKKV